MTFVLDETSLASVNGPDKGMRLSHCYFYIKKRKKQVIGVIVTFLLPRYTKGEKSGTKKQQLNLCKTQRIVHRDRNIFDEFSFHFTEELPVNSSHFELYEQFILL